MNTQTQTNEYWSKLLNRNTAKKEDHAKKKTNEQPERQDFRKKPLLTHNVRFLASGPPGLEEHATDTASNGTKYFSAKLKGHQITLNENGNVPEYLTLEDNIKLLLDPDKNEELSKWIRREYKVRAKSRKWTYAVTGYVRFFVNRSYDNFTLGGGQLNLRINKSMIQNPVPGTYAALRDITLFDTSPEHVNAKEKREIAKKGNQFEVITYYRCHEPDRSEEQRRYFAKIKYNNDECYTRAFTPLQWHQILANK